jgi:hypothetical protein
MLTLTPLVGSGASDTTTCTACISTCNIGQYLSEDICDGLGKDNRQCHECRKACPTGTYLETECLGSQTNDVTICKTCEPCALGQYISQACSGINSDDQQCYSCQNQECELGFKLTSQCNGYTYEDNSDCVQCDAACYAGEYIDGTCTSFTCKTCSGSCSPGYYISKGCTGTTDHDTICNQCTTVCAVGEFISGTCSGETTSDAVICTKCETVPGSFTNTACTGTSTSDDAVYSNCITTCPEGQYIDGSCLGFSDYECSTCRDTCGPAELETVQCTQQTNRACIPQASCSQPCPVGTYLTTPCVIPHTPRVCTPCGTSCPAGYELSTGEYDAGYYISAECTETTDIQCTKCSSDCLGSQSSTVSYNAQSTLHCSGISRYNEIICAVTDPYNLNCGTTHYKADFLMRHPTLCSTSDSLYTFAEAFFIVQNVFGNYKRNHWNFRQSPDLSTMAIVDVEGILWFADLTGSGKRAMMQLYGFTQEDVSAQHFSGIIWDESSNAVYAISDGIEAVYRCPKPNWDTMQGGVSMQSWEIWPSSRDAYTKVSSSVQGVAPDCVLWDTRSLTNIPAMAPTTYHSIKSNDGVLVSTPGSQTLLFGHSTTLESDRIILLDLVTKDILFRWMIPQDETPQTPQTNPEYPAYTFGSYTRTLTSNLVYDYSRSIVYVMTKYTNTNTYISLISKKLEIWSITYDTGSRTLGSGTLLYREGYPNFQGSHSYTLAYSSMHNSLIYSAATDTYSTMMVDIPEIHSLLAMGLPYTTSFLREQTTHNTIQILNPGEMEQLWFSNTGQFLSPSRGPAMRTYCFPCMNNAFTAGDGTHMSDCHCKAGYYKSNMGTCEECRENTGSACDTGYYKTGVTCAAGSTLDMSCAPCGKICPIGYYITGYCDGTGSTDTTACAPCKKKCDGYLLATGCTLKNCVMGQVFLYHMDGGNTALGIDNGPNMLNMISISQYRASSGPTRTHQAIAKTGLSSANFNSAASEYFSIPTHSFVSAEGFTISMWIRMHSSLGDRHIFMELGNGIDAESIIISRNGMEFDFCIRTMADSSTTETTTGSRVRFDNIWQHVSWTVAPGITAVQATWIIKLDDNIIINTLATYPKMTKYSNNFIGYGTAVQTPFLDADIDDVRMYNRVLSDTDQTYVFLTDACCTSTSGQYIGDTDTCNGISEFDNVPCMNCQSDCGDGNYVSDASSLCTGIGLLDSTHCESCSKCSPGQFMTSSCPGTGYSDIVTCINCQYITDDSCGTGNTP